MDPQYAYKVIGQFEGTKPSSGYSYVDFIQSSKTGVTYDTKSAVIMIRFHSNVVGKLDVISIVKDETNIKQFQIDLFDFDNNLLFSKQTTYSSTDG